MSDNSPIEWTDATWNPIRGCTRVSAGCKNCYAEKVAHRFSGQGQPYEGLTTVGANGKPRWNGNIMLVERHMLDPLRWKRPRMVFVNSMSDLFHENVTDATIDRVFAIMALARIHTFQVLTKRPERMRDYLTAEDVRERIAQCARAIGKNLNHYVAWPLPNVWLGVSVEDQKTADERIVYLLETPAEVRWISAEPLLDPIDLTRYLDTVDGDGMPFNRWLLENIEAPPLDWVVVGGESGTHVRPMHPEWARSIRDQCVAAGIPFFFKQWGQWTPNTDLSSEPDAWMHADGRLYPDEAGALAAGGTWTGMHSVGKKNAGRLLDGREWNEMPNSINHNEVTA